jgi:spectinomycin phosphotransferase
MRSPPVDLAPERLREALAGSWQMRADSIDYVPEGGGSHHWKVMDDAGQPHFVTVDDLDDKDWMGDTRDAVFDGLARALGTAAALRDDVGLEFVVAPRAGRDGELLHRVDDGYTVSVFPFLQGRSYPFGPYTDRGLRDGALDMLIALHQSTTAVRARAPHHVPRFGGARDLHAFLADPHGPWEGGPFSEPARQLLASHTADLTELTTGFDRLVDLTAPARADPVITHGEPHPGNVMSVAGRLFLIDWDTAALAAPERDLSLIAVTAGEGIGRYEEATGRRIDPAVITLYRLRWYLDDLASAVRLFRHPHRDTADTRRWWDGLEPRVEQLPEWLDLLGVC